MWTMLLLNTPALPILSGTFNASHYILWYRHDITNFTLDLWEQGAFDWQISFSRKCRLIYLSIYSTVTSWRKHRHGSIDILESTGHDKTSWDYRMRSKVTIKFIALVEILSLLIRVQQKTNKNSTYFYKARNNKSKAILNL